MVALLFRYVIREPQRGVLTAIPVAVACFVFALAMSVPKSIDQALTKAGSGLRLFVYNATARDAGLPSRYCHEIKDVPGVLGCSAVSYSAAVFREAHEPLGVFAVDDPTEEAFPDYGFPPDVREKMIGVKAAAVVGTALLQRLGWRVGQHFMLSLESGNLPLEFELAGEIPGGHYPNILMIRRDYYRDALKAQGESKFELAELLIVRVERANMIGQVSRQVDVAYRNSDYQTRTVTEAEAIATTISSVQNLGFLMYIFAATILAVMFFVTSNSTILTVRERMRDVAVLRSLGFGRLFIVGVFGGEVTIVATLGAAAGILIANLVVALNLFPNSLVGGEAGQLHLETFTSLEAVVLSVVVAIAAGILPLRQALIISVETALAYAD